MPRKAHRRTGLISRGSLSKSKIAETVQLLAIIFSIFFCLLVLVWLVSSGKLNMPGGGGGGGIF